MDYFRIKHFAKNKNKQMLTYCWDEYSFLVLLKNTDAMWHIQIFAIVIFCYGPKHMFLYFNTNTML